MGAAPCRSWQLRKEKTPEELRPAFGLKNASPARMISNASFHPWEPNSLLASPHFAPGELAVAALVVVAESMAGRAYVHAPVDASVSDLLVS